VRSLSSQFKWVTCPAALERLNLDRQRFGFNKISLDALSLSKMQAITHSTQPSSSTESLYLEEYRFNSKGQDLDKVLQLLKPLLSSDYTQTQLDQQLVIVSNDDFSYLVQHATPVNAHIAIESETKTVRTGALWYEETLPPETVLYVGITAVNARSSDCLPEWQARKVLSVLLDIFEAYPWLQIGGNATVGMGWCAICDSRDYQAQGEA
jgi:CRISPR-associated protein Cmr4